MGCCQGCLGKDEAAEPLGGAADRRPRGERLGGQLISDQESAETRRQRALLAAERRAGKNPPTKSRAPHRRQQRPSHGGGRDRTPARSDAPVDAQSEAARAAERRQAPGSHSHTGFSAERHRQLTEKRKRDELAGKIEHYAQLAGEDPPFGLRAASIEVLNRHLTRMKAAARRKGVGAR